MLICRGWQGIEDLVDVTADNNVVATAFSTAEAASSSDLAGLHTSAAPLQLASGRKFGVLLIAERETVLTPSELNDVMAMTELMAVMLDRIEATEKLQAHASTVLHEMMGLQVMAYSYGL